MLISQYRDPWGIDQVVCIETRGCAAVWGKKGIEMLGKARVDARASCQALFLCFCTGCESAARVSGTGKVQYTRYRVCLLRARKILNRGEGCATPDLYADFLLCSHSQRFQTSVCRNMRGCSNSLAKTAGDVY